MSRTIALVGVSRLAEMIGRSEKWVYRRIGTSELPTAHKIGNSYKFFTRDVEAWIEKHAIGYRRGRKKRTS